MEKIKDKLMTVIPEWAAWLAVDKNGCAYVYEMRPTHGEDYRWYSFYGKTAKVGCVELPDDMDWRFAICEV